MTSDILQLEIAGIGVALTITDPGMIARVREHYADFIVAAGQPQVNVEVKTIPGARFVPERPGPWVIETQLEKNHLTYRSYFDAGWVDLERRVGGLETAPEADLENFLRVLYAHLCLRHGGLLLHASGVVKGQAGYVFFGASGNGKTTVAQLSLGLGYIVLSDDLVILKTSGDQCRVFGVPFRGTLPEAPRTNAVGNLTGLFALAKDTRHYLVEMSKSRAVSRLAACAPFVMTEPAHAGQVMKICAELATRVPVRELHFSRDAGFWEVIHEPN